ncbi:class I SAM-dependent methyltransferase [Actinomadura craniellae]|uniref:class I SAM-dependent methyltransferase n=1 Tax=Actinomadura craniellae TaxID=2231787 RepID=UPI001F442017|nr:class I SAM-dependent methyltransferase [Actinomadura craniellae]
MLNTEQFEAWNGAEGAAWAAKVQDTGDGPEAELHRLLLAAARVGGRDRVLDVGCGTGDLSALAARRAPDGHVLGIDLSAPMLSRARRAAAGAGLGNVAFEQADAQTCALPEDGFDAAVSMYGVMFFADPVAALTNIGRALRPGGRLAFVCPQPPADCAWYVIPVAALLDVPPQAAVDAYPGPEPAMFSLSDRARLGRVLAGAGFGDVSIEPVHVPHLFGRTPAQAADGFLASGPTRYIVEQDAGLTRERAHTKLTAVLEAYAGPGGVLLPGGQWLVGAVWPGEVRL